MTEQKLFPHRLVSERLRHIKGEQILLIHHITTEVETYIPPGLYCDAQTYAEIGKDAFYLSRSRAHESASAPSHIAYVIEHLFHPCTLVCIYHLAIFCHHYMR